MYAGMFGHSFAACICRHLCSMIYSRYNPRFPLKFGAKVQKIFVFRKFFLSKNHADSEIFMPNFVVPRNFGDESWSIFLAYVKKKRAKRGWCLHNSKKCSNFAAETEDGVAGGAHAEPIPTSSEQAQVRSRRALGFQYIY